MQILKTFSYHTLLILFVIFSSTNHNSKSTDKLIIVNKNIQVKSYFQYIDSIVKHYNSINNYKLSEHILVRHNPWIIDSLANTDYYRMIAKDSFVYNQKDLIVLRKGCSIKIPDSLESSNIEKEFKSTWIDLNIPEYKLRIYRDSVLLHEFLVRVGRNEKKYLKMAGRVLDLKTKTGSGTIVKYVKNPDYYNPVNGNQYFVTNRDDGKVTKLPNPFYRN